MNNPGKTNCCFVVSVFGYNLKQGVFGVCVAAIVISTIALITSIATILSIKNKDLPSYTHRPVQAVGLLFALYCCGIATYQIVISALLLWNTWKTTGSLFYCSLWYISHLSIIGFYICFFIATTVACACAKQYVLGTFTIIGGLLYAGVFIYFCAIVNSFSYTINQLIYY